MIEKALEKSFKKKIKKILPWMILFFWNSSFSDSKYENSSRLRSSLFPESLNAVSQLNKHNDCLEGVHPRCPQTLVDLVQDDDKKKAFIVEPYSARCKEKLKEHNLDKASTFKDINSEIVKDLGEEASHVIKFCTHLEPDKSYLYYSKLYYYLNRLNQGALKINYEQILQARILGTEPPPCSGTGVLEKSFQLCNKLNQCPVQESRIDFFERIKSEEKSFLNAVSELKKLTKNCSDEDCENKKTSLQKIIFGLSKKNPWFLDKDFAEGKGKVTDYFRLKKYFENSNKKNQKALEKIQKSANCLQGKERCPVEDIRAFVDLMPEFKLLSPSDNLSAKENENIKKIYEFADTQKCIEPKSIDRDQTGKLVKESSLQFSLLFLTGLIGLGGKLAEKGIITFSNSWRVLAEGANLSADAAEFLSSITNLEDSCSGGDFDIKSESESNKDLDICSQFESPLSAKNQQEGQCWIDAGLTASSGLILIPGLRGLKNSLSEGNKNQILHNTEVPNLIEKRRVNGKEAPPSKIANTNTNAKINNKDGPSLPLDEGVIIKNIGIDSLKVDSSYIGVHKREFSNGTSVLEYEIAKKLPDGRSVKVTKEFLIDPISGGIDASFSSGRELFDFLVREKAGKAALAFIDVGSLRTVNKTFKGGKKAGEEAGDRYLRSVAEKIIQNGEGKITLARLGGDEYGLLIDETDPQKVKQILEKIQESIRKDEKADARKVFREEKALRAKEFKDAVAKGADKNDPKLRARVTEIAQVQQPDISIGSAQIGSDDTLESLLLLAEEQAKNMKIQSALQFGRSAKKYGSNEVPRSRPDPKSLVAVESPRSSQSWSKQRTKFPDEVKNLSEIKLTREKVIKELPSGKLVRYKDELGNSRFKFEQEYIDPKTKNKSLISLEIPTRGESQILDGRHPLSQKIVMEHIETNPDSVLIVPSLKSLKYVNYFQDGTQAGDKILDAVSTLIKENLRGNDLSFKLNGADFLWSIDVLSKEELTAIQTRMNQLLKESNQVTSILAKERTVLKEKLAQAQKSADIAKSTELQRKLKQLDNFDPRLEMQMLSREELDLELSKQSTLKDIVDKIDDLFAGD